MSPTDKTALEVLEPGAPIPQASETATPFDAMDGIDVDLAPSAEGLGGAPVEVPAHAHDDNLVSLLSPTAATGLLSELTAAVAQDVVDRADWEETYRKGVELLGFKFEEVSEPWDGAAGSRHPLLAEAVVQFQSRTTKALMPAGGPVRSKVLGPLTPRKQAVASRVVEEMNRLFTMHVDYRVELSKMAFNAGLSGSGFLKQWYDERLQRPKYVSISPEDLILSADASDASDAARVTHQMRPLPRDVLASPLYHIPDDYRNKLTRSDADQPVDAGSSVVTSSVVEEEKADISGVDTHHSTALRVLEIQCHLDLSTYDTNAPVLDGEGVKPYVVTIDTTNNQLLAVRRNWRNDDPKHVAQSHIYQFCYLTSDISPYGLGLVHLLGQTSETATAVLRTLLDGGALSSLQAGFKTRGLRFKDPDGGPLKPGEFRDVDVSMGKIAENIYQMQFPEPSNVLFSVMTNMVEAGRQMAASATSSLSELPHNAASFAVLALIEKEIEPQADTHIRFHTIFAQLLRDFKQLIRDFMKGFYPYEAVEPQEGQADAAAIETLRQDDFSTVDVLPVSNPNEASSGTRMLKMQAVMQLYDKFPEQFDRSAMARFSIALLGETDFDQLLAQQVDPAPLDPVSENMNFLTGKPTKVFPEQDHQAHLAVHQNMLNDPRMQQMAANPAMQPVLQAVQAHLAEHMAYAYRQEVEQYIGQPLPPPGKDMQTDNQVAMAAAQATRQLLQDQQRLAAQQQAAAEANDPLNIIQREELRIKERQVSVDEQDRREKRILEAARLILDANKDRAKNASELMRLLVDVRREYKEDTNAEAAGSGVPARGRRNR